MADSEYKQHRAEAEMQRDSDLKKTLPHLVADIHDESARGDRDADVNLVHVLKRFAAMLAIASESGDRTATALTKWTKGIAWLTVAIVFLTAVLIYFAWRTDAELHDVVEAYNSSRNVSSSNHPQNVNASQHVVRPVLTVPQTKAQSQPRPVEAQSVVPSTMESDSPAQSPPSPAPPEWHEVTTFDGGDLSSPGSSPETDTDSFAVGDRWRIVWSTKSGKYGDQGTLTVFIQDAPGSHGTSSEGGMALAHSGAGAGDELKYGAGQYYFKILANEPYHIRILSQ